VSAATTHRAKKGKSKLLRGRLALTRSGALAFAAILAVFTVGIFCVFLTVGELCHALPLLLSGDGKRKKNRWGGRLRKQLVWASTCQRLLSK
jgi:hypothetical protein